MKNGGITVRYLVGLSDLRLSVLAGHRGLDRHITVTDVNRPGLALAGYYRDFATDRLQVIGKGEYSFISDCRQEEQEVMGQEFLHQAIPAVVFTHGKNPPDCFRRRADQAGIPLLVSSLTTHDFIMHFSRRVTDGLARGTKVHGVLLDVSGIGILLQGPSGIGKSETALELIERGHRLVADDMVEIRCVGDAYLSGVTDNILEHNMELRGIGIIDVKELFGAGAVRREIRVDMVIELEDWQLGRDYERLGVDDDRTSEILGVKLPLIVLPVRPGRNLPILIETAAMNHRLKSMGIHAGRELSERIQREIRRKREESIREAAHPAETGAESDMHSDVGHGFPGGSDLSPVDGREPTEEPGSGGPASA